MKRNDSRENETCPDLRAILAVAWLCWLPARRNTKTYARFDFRIRLVCYSFFPIVIWSWYEQDIHSERRATLFYHGKIAVVNGRWKRVLKKFGPATDFRKCAWAACILCKNQIRNACTHVDGRIRKPQIGNCVYDNDPLAHKPAYIRHQTNSLRGDQYISWVLLTAMKHVRYECFLFSRHIS